MNIHTKTAALVAAISIAALSSSAIAQVPVKPHPPKAAPIAPVKAVANFSMPRSNVAPALTKKPPVVTAVAPKTVVPVPGGTAHGIIFVGGKAKTSGDSALNPQPIPPGRPPVDPVR